MGKQLNLTSEDKKLNKEFEKPKTFREELLERITRLEETTKNHLGKHKYQVIIECSILATIIYKIVLG